MTAFGFWLVIAWNVVALVSLSVALVGLGGALADWEYLRQRRLNGIRSIAATRNVRGEIIMAVVNLIFLLLGVLVLVDVTGRGDISRLGLVLASALMLGGSIANWIDRRRLIRLVIAEEQNTANGGHA